MSGGARAGLALPRSRDSGLPRTPGTLAFTGTHARVSWYREGGECHKGVRLGREPQIRRQAPSSTVNLRAGQILSNAGHPGD